MNKLLQSTLYTALCLLIGLQLSAQCSNINNPNKAKPFNQVFGDQSFGQSIKVDAACFSGDQFSTFSFYSQGNSPTKMDLRIYSGENFQGDDYRYIQKDIQLPPANLGSKLTIDLAGGSGDLSFVPGNTYTFLLTLAKSGGGNLIAHVSEDAVAGGKAFLKTGFDSGKDLLYEVGAKSGSIPSGWNKIAGKARAVAAGAQGKVFVAGFDSPELYQWSHSGNQWVRVGRQAVSFAVASNGDLWTVTEAGEIWRFSGSWNKMPGKARAVAAGAQGKVIVAGFDSPELYSWSESGNQWVRVGRQAISFDIASNGDLWTVTEAGEIWRFSGSWNKIPGKARAVAAGAYGKVLVAGFDSPELYSWSESGNQWVRVGRQAVSFDIASSGNLWTVTAAGEIWRFH